MSVPPQSVRSAKKKSTERAVTGKITVMGSNGDKIGQWGGTECFLSVEKYRGPCFVVRSAKHRRGQGTFFALKDLQGVLSNHVHEGKLTLKFRYQNRHCSLFVKTTESDLAEVDMLRYIAETVVDKTKWSDMERNVTCPDLDRESRGGKRVREAEIELDDMLDEEPAPRDAGAPDDEASEVGEGEYYNTQMTQNMNVARLPELQLTSEQQRALYHIRQGDNVFVTGCAGTGKTLLLRKVVQALQAEGDALAVTATTGIGATEIGGQTLHSFAGIGLGDGTERRQMNRTSATQRGRTSALVPQQRFFKPLSEKIGYTDQKLSVLSWGGVDQLSMLCRKPRGGQLHPRSNPVYQK